MQDTSLELEVPNVETEDVSTDQLQADMIMNDPALQNQNQSEIDRRLNLLREEFGDRLTDIIVDAEFNDDVANFLMEKADQLKEVTEKYSSKTRFYLHRDSNGDFYILRSLKPSEFHTPWLALLSGTTQAYEEHVDPFLQAMMAYPTYDETAWDHEDDKMNAPSALTKSMLIGTYFEYELPDPNTPRAVDFRRDDLTPATEVARRKKPSL